VLEAHAAEAEAEPLTTAALPAPTPAAVASDVAALIDLTDEIEEVTFFAQQGLEDEAREALQGLLAKYPDHPELLALKPTILVESAPETAAIHEPVAVVNESSAAALFVPPPILAVVRADAADVDVEPEPETEPEPEPLELKGDDLVAELEQELAQAAADDDFQVSFSDVFDEFKKGVAKTVDASDYDTHYNLGIAYKEMGLLEDAVREFETAVTAAGWHIGALTMIGLCYLELDKKIEAVDAFMRGLAHEKVKPEEAMALRYEVGSAYEAMGKFAEALRFYEKVAATDPNFREVAARLDQMRAQAPSAPASTSDELDVLLSDTPTPKPRRDSKTTKISYV